MKITSEQIVDMYNNKTIAEMREALGGISNNRLYAILDQIGCKRKVFHRKHRRIERIEIV